MLASGAPRRQELLRDMGVKFDVVTKPGVSEVFPDTLSAKDVPEFIAREKAQAYIADLNEDDVLITADTVVVVDKQILGKPKDETEARQMLKMLSGRSHRVITGVAIATTSGIYSFSVKTKVTFRSLAPEVIDFYVDSARPLDKAGAYGIQEWIGLVGIDYIEGSYQNVMGLPTQRLFAELSALR